MESKQKLAPVAFTLKTMGRDEKHKCEEHFIQSLRRQGYSSLPSPCFLSRGGRATFLGGTASVPLHMLVRVPWPIPRGPRGWTCDPSVTITRAYSTSHSNWCGDSFNNQSKTNQPTNKKTRDFSKQSWWGNSPLLSGCYITATPELATTRGG